jgi:glycosyltransferase involved in cell wall biosynthesis
VSRRRIYFVFADPRGFSGQREAARLVFESLDSRRWDVRLIRMPALERNQGQVLTIPRYIFRLIAAWWRCLGIAMNPKAAVFLSIGQTRAALVRDSFPRLCARVRGGLGRLVVSIQGSNFMEWPRNSAIAQRFTRFLSNTGTVAVLGRKQEQRLRDLGIRGTRTEIVLNACAAEVVERESVVRKHSKDSPIQLLHLSSLIDTKGYPEFLETLAALSKEAGPRIEAVLCGNIVMSQFGDRFASERSARLWIETKLAEINESRRVAVRWIEGATGSAKWALFRVAHLFVFPSRYPVEAQPLVVLEAMAHGAVPIVTDIGEMREIVDDSCARIVTQPNVSELVALVNRLHENRGLREELAVSGLDRVKRHHSVEAYRERYEAILMRSTG